MQQGTLKVIVQADDTGLPLEEVTRNWGPELQVCVVSSPDDLLRELDGNEFRLVIARPQVAAVPEVISALRKAWQEERLLLVLVGDDAQEGLDHEFVYDVLEPHASPLRIARLVHNARAHLLLRQNVRALSAQLEEQAQDLHELNQIGIALSSERDLDVLLEMILRKSREITSADAGSLYLVEQKPGVPIDEHNPLASKQLRFKLSHNDSLQISYNEFVMPIEKRSMAGYVALTGEPLNIEDAYDLPPDAEFSHNRSFDLSTGYRTKSILGVPMRTHKGEIIGVLQLINRKRHWEAKLTTPEAIAEEILPFDEKCVHLASSLASQAAVAIENTRLYQEIKELFEGFVRASVLAIEQRDPTTFGHSERVATLSVGIAEVVDRVNTGPYRDVHFTRDQIQQIKYAGLLHDFGKIGVREHVLVKAKKLYPTQLDIIKARFRYLKRALQQRYTAEKVRYFLTTTREEALRASEHLDEEFARRLRELDDYLEFIIKANEPTVLPQGGLEKLLEIAELWYEDDGERIRYLDEAEVKLLSIPKGSLSDEERAEIESHVTHTYNFLCKIPWTSELKPVPEIAYAHHEKLNGSGYPRRLSAPDIPVQSRMMAIADIYDALTAWDRPYKRAVPTEKALDILRSEVQAGLLDGELFRLFVEAEVFRQVSRPQPSP
ncbi:MAG: GAF domain-containing protein [candidate division KSB1 bacterium]|nr:GAF domain-containing protein [candidate division KSB1 bacterium]